MDSLSGKSILVVEDDYLEASELKHRLTEAGINVVGPAPNVEQALELITTTEALAGAVLDINLSGEMVFPVADELERLGVPFIFATGYERDVFPPRLADGILLRKPVGEHAVISALLRARDVDEVSVAEATRNAILAKLAVPDLARVIKLMHKTHLPQGAIIERPGQRVNAIYFPFDCILSLLVVGPEGSRIETGLIGREGMTGSAVADQDSETPYELITQVGGEAFVLPVNDFQRLIDIAPTLEILARRFARVLSIQVSFTALANGRFDIPQRLARWLVMVQDRMPSGNELRLTHDYLAVMLGVRRPSVTEALHILEGERFIRSTRGQIEILSRNGLIQFAGELYGSAEREHARLMSPPLPNLARLQGMRRTEKVPDRRATGREVSGHG